MDIRIQQATFGGNAAERSPGGQWTPINNTKTHAMVARVFVAWARNRWEMTICL